MDIFCKLWNKLIRGKTLINLQNSDNLNTNKNAHIMLYITKSHISKTINFTYNDNSNKNHYLKSVKTPIMYFPRYTIQLNKL